MKLLFPAIAAAILASGLSAKPPLPSFTTTPSGLRYVDMRPGRGGTPQAGQTCSVLYRGWIYNENKRGAMFDAAQDPKRPFQFVFGQGKVIPGWDEGLKTMKPGGKRVLIIPPSLAYGDQGAGEAVPPKATLLFEVELLRID